MIASNCIRKHQLLFRWDEGSALDINSGMHDAPVTCMYIKHEKEVHFCAGVAIFLKPGTENG